MNNSHVKVFASSLLLITLGVLLTDPFDITMNNMTLILISGLLLASFGMFAGLMWNEKAADEREGQLIDQGGRFAYLTGMSVLLVALIVQSFDHHVDIWLIIAIVVMILSKQFYIHLKK